MRPHFEPGLTIMTKENIAPLRQPSVPEVPSADENTTLTLSVPRAIETGSRHGASTTFSARRRFQRRLIGVFIRCLQVVCIAGLALAISAAVPAFARKGRPSRTHEYCLASHGLALRSFIHVPGTSATESVRGLPDRGAYRSSESDAGVFGWMTRKLSVTESRKLLQFLGTLSRKKSSVASANCPHVA